MQKTFHPDTPVLCENDECGRFFHQMFYINNIVNVDENNEISKAVFKDGKINRVKCPFCGKEFTYEIRILIYSEEYGIYAVGCDKCSEDFIYTAGYENALRISGNSSLKLRITANTAEASEKIRLCAFEIDDGKAELFKLCEFPKYKEMRYEYEYIMFDTIENDTMIFTHRNYFDEIIDTYRIPKEKFDKFNININPQETNKWLKINKEWTLRYLEDKQ